MHAEGSIRDGSCLAGFGRAEITLPTGAPLRGYYHPRLCDGVRDPLFARAIVLEQGGARVVLVSCDLCCIESHWAVEARRRAAARAGVSTGHVVIAATHTHTGPIATPEISATLIAKVESAVAAAVKDVASCELSHAAVDAPPSLAFNRRYWLADGSVATNPDVGRDQIKGPAGPVDPTVSVLFFQRPGRSAPAAALIHYGLHVDCVGGSKASGDWPAVIERELGGVWGAGLHAQFMLAPCGDVNHFDFLGGHVEKGGVESHRIGVALAKAIRDVRETASPLETNSVAARESSVQLPLYQPGRDELARARAILEQGRDGQRDFTLPVVEATKVVRTAKIVAEQGPFSEVPLQLLEIGALKLLAVPMELFVALGQAIAKDISPRLWVVTLANDSLGYLPSSEAYRQGGYEVVSSNFLSSAPEIFAAGANDLLRRRI